MFDDFKVANYSKALVSPELYARHLSRLFAGDVVDGLTVMPGTGLQVVLQPGNTFIRYGSGAVASARLVSLVNTFSLAIATPDVSNPRHDLVVVYVDTSVSLPGGTPSTANLDGKGVAKAVVVKGTAASSPSDPNATAIQAAIGSSAYSYIIVARVRVNAGVSVIAANLITDLRDGAKVGVKNIDFSTMPKFKANRTSSLNFPRNTTTVFAVDSVEYNIGGGTVSGGRYTVPLAGKYQLDASFVILDSPVSGWIVVYVNGSAYSFQEYASGSSYPTMRACCSLPLAAGDIVDVRFRNEQPARDPIIHVEPTQPRSAQFSLEYVGY